MYVIRTKREQLLFLGEKSMNRELTFVCITLIVSINGVFIATGSPLSFLHYLTVVGCVLPLAYKLGKESKK